MWFDVEKRYNTTPSAIPMLAPRLWFDVEKRYNTTDEPTDVTTITLWFDVEKRYNTTIIDKWEYLKGCGLM